jgi:DMSO/TMAO reductase YedYZ molybdopterin-dependent catalytic subunit
VPRSRIPARRSSGWVGINNIKWVGRIEVRNSVIDVPTTTKTYVLEGPDYCSKVVLRQQTIKSAVALPGAALLAAGSACAVSPGRRSAASAAWNTASTAEPRGSRPRSAAQHPARLGTMIEGRPPGTTRSCAGDRRPGRRAADQHLERPGLWLQRARAAPVKIT